MNYKIGEWSKARKDFCDAFGISIQPFYDGLMTLVFGCIQIDPYKFDDWLYQKHKDYIDGVSMEQIIQRHYGARGRDVLLALLPGADAKLNEELLKKQEKTELQFSLFEEVT